MSDLKKKKKSGPNTNDMVEEIFFYAFVKMYMKDLPAVEVVSGILLDIDDSFYYLGDTVDGIQLSVRKELVALILFAEEPTTVAFAEAMDDGEKPPKKGDMN